MEIVAMPPVWSQSSSELLSTLDTLKAAVALLKTYELQLINRLDEMGTAQELGARDTTELVSLRYRVDPAEVRKDLTFAGCLPKYPAVTAALPDPGDPSCPATLSPDQAKVIVATLEKAPASVPVEVLTVAEEQLIEAARVTSPRELTRFARKVLATLDTDGPEPAEDEARAKESLRLRRSDGGVKFNGFLAGDSAELLETQIHKLSKPHKTIDGELDPRPRDKRQADALRSILDAAAGNPDYPGVPHVTVTIDFNDLSTALVRGLHGPGPAAGGPGALSGFDAVGGLGTVGGSGVVGRRAAVEGPDAMGGPIAVGGSGVGAVGELVFGGNLSASAVRLMACDASVLPIVLGGDSQPLDVGTEQRFVSRYLRRALNKRDKGCVVCKAPPWICHAHHLIHWADGGPTSLQNLALLCAAHHRAVHKGQWTLSSTAGRVEVTRPHWADPPREPSPTLANWFPPAHNTSSASTASVGSNPTHEQPTRLPTASTLPNPTLAAAREALRTRLTALAPNHSDPWGMTATPAAGP